MSARVRVRVSHSCMSAVRTASARAHLEVSVAKARQQDGVEGITVNEICPCALLRMIMKDGNIRRQDKIVVALGDVQRKHALSDAQE